MVLLQFQIFGGGGSSANVSKLVGEIGIILIYIIVIFVLGWLLWKFFIKPMFYPIRVIVYSKRGDRGVFIYEDKARFTRKRTGYEDFKLLKRHKAHVRSPSLDYLYNGSRGTAYLHLEEVDKSTYVPLLIPPVSKYAHEAIKITAEQKQWVMLEVNKLLQSLQPRLNLIEKYAPYIAFIITMIICLIIVWIIFGQYTETNAILSATQEKVAATYKEVFGGITGAAP